MTDITVLYVKKKTAFFIVIRDGSEVMGHRVTPDSFDQNDAN